MASSHGLFVWHELMTNDMEGAKTFYGDVLGLTCADPKMPGPPYWIFSAGEGMVAGLMNIPAESLAMGAPPMWTGYIHVDDVDASTAKLKDMGGSVIRPPEDIPGVGRFSVVADPQGAVFELFNSTTPPPANPPAPDTPGRVGWNELYADDMEKVFPFYAEMFGWKKGDAIDMGAMGTYQLFEHEGLAIGGMMTRPPHVPHAVWGFYFNVANIDGGIARATAGGGRIVHGPVQVPGGYWVAQGVDPQGVGFAMVGPRA